MSRFLSSLSAEPEPQRIAKASLHLRALVFGRLSDEHVLALALLGELGGIYHRAYDTDQVLSGGPHLTQEGALAAHLRAQGLPCEVAELDAAELGRLTARVSTWSALPRPFGRLVRALVRRARAQQAAPLAPLPAASARE